MSLNEQAQSLLEQIAAEMVALSPTQRDVLIRVQNLLTNLDQALTDAGPVRELALQASRIAAALPEEPEACAAELARMMDLLERMRTDSESIDASAEIVDDSLRREFIASQESTLHDFEAESLALGGGDLSRRAAVLRQLHTWKGEASLIGFNDLAAAMHQAEGVLQEIPQENCAQLSDAALAVKDYVAEYFRARQNNAAVPAFDVNTLRAVQQEPAAPAAAASTPAVAESALVFPLPDDLDLELMQEFLTESAEHFQSAEAALMKLEINPEDAEAINTVFRSFHTIKGVSSFLGVTCITEFTHRAEAFFDRIRKGQLSLKGHYTDLAFEALDVTRGLLKALPESVGEGKLIAPIQYGPLKARLENPEQYAAAENAAAPAPAAVAATPEPAAVAQAATPVPVGSDAEPAPATPAADAPAASVADRPKASAGGAKPGDSDTTVKVNTSRLDNLINMVGELVIAQSMVSQDPFIQTSANQRLVRNVSQLAKITRALQELALSMRMVSVKSSFQKMARLVRDLARKSQKEIEFETEGEDTELDRNMVEAIADPLVHMVRNAVDHGLEMPADRVAAGKPRQGHVKLSAAHEGGSVVIRLSDDGRGLNKEKILRKAVERGLVAPGATLTDAEIFNLIFLPGFSTADKVTDVSGRGVGMDVVRTNIEALRGNVEIGSEPGRGSTFSVRLPLTLAIIDGMVVRVGTERFIVPTIAITESLQPEAKDITTVQNRGEVINLRGALVPVCRLVRLMNIQGGIDDLTQGILVVIEGKNRRAALLVDELMGQQQVVIKNLGASFGQVRGISGGAILGDGKISLILDVDGIIAWASRH